MIRNKIAQRGDTIVEVLIAVALVSSVLAITFATMNRNNITMRDNQEHTEASKIAQSQAEALLDKWNRAPATIPTNSNGFCIDASGNVKLIDSGNSPRIDPSTENYSVYATAGCQTADQIYNFGIKRNASGAYVISVRWFKFGSDIRNERVIVYRVN